MVEYNIRLVWFLAVVAESRHTNGNGKKAFVAESRHTTAKD